MQVLRFVNIGGNTVKRNLPIIIEMAIEVEIFNQNVEDAGQQKRTYDFCGAMCHTGKTANDGHYISIVRDWEKKKLVKIDDDRVIVLGEAAGRSVPEELRRQIYILFYRCRR